MKRDTAVATIVGGRFRTVRDLVNHLVSSGLTSTSFYKFLLMMKLVMVVVNHGFPLTVDVRLNHHRPNIDSVMTTMRQKEHIKDTI